MHAKTTSSSSSSWQGHDLMEPQHLDPEGPLVITSSDLLATVHYLCTELNNFVFDLSVSSRMTSHLNLKKRDGESISSFHGVSQ